MKRLIIFFCFLMLGGTINSTNQQQRNGSVQVVKNCIALLPDNGDPVTVHVHVKRFSDSDRSIGFVEDGLFYLFSSIDGGLERIYPTRDLDPAVARDYPYYVSFNTPKGSIVCFLPNLNITTIPYYNMVTKFM